MPILSTPSTPPTLAALLRSGLLALALAGGAQAAVVTVDFSVDGSAGPGSGSLSFDDGAGSHNPFGETEFALSAFSFDFDGARFTASDLGSAWVVYDGTTLLGLDATSARFSFVPSVAGADAFFVDRRSQRSSSVAFERRDPLTVPEPATALLALLAGTAAWVGRRPAAMRRSMPRRTTGR